MRRYRIAWLLALGLGSLIASAARAETPTVAVLDIEAIDMPLDLAHQLTEALRQRVSSTGGIRMLAGKDLVEIKLVFGCDNEAPACMAQAGRSLGAEKLLYGALKKAGNYNKDRLTVSLKLLDVKTATIEKSINEVVGRRELGRGIVIQTAARWVSEMIQIDTKPTLTVQSDPPGAAVAVDGQMMGRTPLTLRDLAAGSHAVAISLAGRVTASRNIELRPGGSHEIMVTLEAEATSDVASPTPSRAPEPTPLTPLRSAQAPLDHPGRTAKALGIAAGVGALVATGALIYTWTSYNSLEDQTTKDGLGLQDPTHKNADWSNHPTCTVPSGVTGNIGKYQDDCHHGESLALATSVLWVVAGALATTGVIAYVIGSRQASQASERPSAMHLFKRTLRVAPVVSTQGGGLQARFEF